MDSKYKNRNVFNYILVSISIITSIFFVFIGSNLSSGYEIEPNTISLKKIKAPKDIENKMATEKLKSEAYESLQLVYKKDLLAEENIKKNLESFFTELEQQRKEYKIDKTKIEIDRLSVSDGETINQPDTPIDFSKYDLPIFLSDKQKEIALSTSDKEYASFKKNCEQILLNVLEKGVKNESNEMNSSYIKIKDEFEKIYADSELRFLGYEVLTAYLKANLIVDLGATEKAREQKVLEVDPVMILRDQTIVDEGALITPEIYSVLESLGYTKTNYLGSTLFLIGSSIIIIISIMVIIFYIYKNKILDTSDIRERLMLFIMYNSCIILFWILKDLPHYYLPLLLFTVLISVLMNRRLAILANVFLVVMAYLIVNIEKEYFIYFNLAGIVVSVFSKELADRSKIIITASIASFINALVFFAIALVSSKNFNNEIMYNAMYVFFSVMVTIILAIGSLPFWEAAFGVITPIKLLDLTNPNNPVLRRLTLEAPGTYHHSLIVANLAEAAAIDIGANAIVARVGGYYHDIGKLKYPQYFSENQAGKNPHDNLEPLDSVAVIKSHISYGLVLADEYKLPRVIKDMISMHHGTSLIKYFYHKQLKSHPDENINIDEFRYDYNIPEYREAAVVMLADTVEAAVRSMIPSGKTFDEVKEFVDKLIKDKLDEGQLRKSKLSIEDVYTISEAFLRVIKGMYHERITYPVIDGKVLTNIK